VKRIVLWLLSTISAVVLLFGYHTSTSGPMATTQEPIGASLATTSSATTSGGTGGSGSGSGSGADGTNSGSGGAQTGSTVKGAIAQTRWGPVQVQVTTDGSGTITAVEVVQYPSGNSTDEQINSYALPILVQSTLDAQSARVDMVSGATVTSEGYVQSLQSALDQA
jgi:uncharacterized protein with FMN-binding domain